MGEQVVANFSASWCGPCRSIASEYRELADKYPSIIFLTVDVDELAVSNRKMYATTTVTMPKTKVNTTLEMNLVVYLF